MCVQQSEREREKEEANPDHDSFSIQKGARKHPVCGRYAPSIRTSAEPAFCPTVKAALRHECADSVEDREGLGAIWSRAYCFEHHLKMAVPSNSALFESIGGNFGYSHGLPLSHCQVLFSAGVFKLWVASRRVGQDGSHKVTWLQLNLHFNDTHRSV